MLKLSLKHKILYLCTLLMIGGWILWSLVDFANLKGNVRLQTVYAVLAILLGIAFFGFTACIIYPDISYTSKKINDNNRYKIYYIRRTLFCMIQMLYVFFLGGVSISLFYERWRLGVGLVSAVFVGCFAVILILYGIHVADCFRNSGNPDESTEGQGE